MAPARKRTTRKAAKKRAPARKAAKRRTVKKAVRKTAKKTVRKTVKRRPAKKAARKTAKRRPAKKAARKTAKRRPAKKAARKTFRKNIPLRFVHDAISRACGDGAPTARSSGLSRNDDIVARQARYCAMRATRRIAVNVRHKNTRARLNTRTIHYTNSRTIIEQIDETRWNIFPKGLVDSALMRSS